MIEINNKRLKDCLEPFEHKLKPDEANTSNLIRIKKIDFKGNIHLQENTKTKTDMLLVKPGMLVISGINVSKGAVAIYEGTKDATVTIHYSVYKINEKEVNLKYIRYLFQSSLFLSAVNEITKGGIKTEIKSKKLLELPLEFNGNKLQQDNIVKKIDIKIKQLEELKFQSKELHEKIKYMSQSYNQSLIDSLCVDAKSTNILELLEEKGLQNGVSPPLAPDNSSEYFESFSLAATSKGFFDFSKVKKVLSKDIDFEKYSLRSGDILIQRGNSSDFVGISAVYDGENSKYIYPDLMIRLKVNKKILPKYLHIYLMSQKIRGYFKAVASGTNDTMKKINQAKIKKINVPLPTIKEQENLIAKSETFQKNIESVAREAELLVNISKSIYLYAIDSVIN